MNQSADLHELAKALASAQAKLKPAIKDATNPHFRSKYADLQSVWEAARPVLTANNLSVAQTFNESTGETVTIVTTLLHVSGQWMRSSLTLKPTKSDPQGIGSAITYGRRYGLSAILGIVADEDDDGNAASAHHHEPAPAPLKDLPPGWDKWTVLERGENRANAGEEALKAWWLSLSDGERKALKPKLDSDWKPIAAKVKLAA